ncbi:Putative glutamine amidotransferase YafJ [Acidipropionibacterium virtanenii]|uniref:Glutamine amidotransferase YafJ n=2 Tax=Acidipropionibacterium virtanenii TaxID=2057246 RepID=A0A344UUV0_9ACTN|nr:Putative glutamine amidotransferase YafJ [Acidipropionibacterium virtanenii]
MCRLFGFMTDRPRAVAAAAGEDLRTFHDLGRIHRDGWGIAAWQGDEPTVVRDPGPVMQSTRFWPMVDALVTDQAMFHLRLASEGLAVTTENCHPFRAGNVCFAHNGQFDKSPAIVAEASATSSYRPRGTTDSELYFALILGHHERGADWPEAIMAAARTIIDLVPQGRVWALDCLLGTPEALYAFSLAFPEQVPDKPEGYFDLHFLSTEDEGGRSLRISSQGPESPEWTLLTQRTVLRIERSTLTLSTTPWQRPRRARSRLEFASQRSYP